LTSDATMVGRMVAPEMASVSADDKMQENAGQKM
jgi:hypothetical protein